MNAFKCKAVAYATMQGVKISEVAKELQVNQSTVHRYFDGTRGMPIDFLANYMQIVNTIAKRKSYVAGAVKQGK